MSGSGDTYTVTVSLNTIQGTARFAWTSWTTTASWTHRRNPLGGAGIGERKFHRRARIHRPDDSPASRSLRQGFRRRGRPTSGRGCRAQRATDISSLKGSTAVYARIVSSAVCGSTACSSATTTALGMGSHRWRVQAMLGGAWKGYSPYKAFTVSPRAGLWSGYGLDFYVTSSLASVDDFAIYRRRDGMRNLQDHPPSLGADHRQPLRLWRSLLRQRHLLEPDQR